MKLKITLNNNMISGLVFLLFSVILWMIIPLQIVSKNPEVAQTSQFFPKIMTIIIFVCSIGLIMRELLRPSNVMPIIEWNMEARTLVLIGIYIFYVVLLKYTGFIISSIVFVLLTTLHSRERKWSVYCINISAVLFVYMVFVFLLKKNIH